MKPRVVFFAVLLATPSAHAGSKCVEVSDVVGHEKCSRYGDAWSVERTLPFLFRFGIRYGEIAASSASFREELKKGTHPAGYEGFTYRGDRLGVHALPSLGFDGGIAFFVIGQLYLGLEGGLGFGSITTATFSAGRYVLSSDSGIDVTAFHAGIPIGYRIALGRASLRGEVLAGGTGVTVSHAASALSPNVTNESLPSTVSATAWMFLVEPRVAADIWFTQHITFGAYAGVNVVDQASHSIGLSLAWHHRAFDGDMRLW